MRTVRVEASGRYDILIGPKLLDGAGARVAEVIRPCTAALVTDDAVDALYGDLATRSLEAAGFDVRRFAFPSGERQKTLATLGDMLEFFGAQHMSKSDLVVALGGGVVGDAAGFAAAVYARGTRFVQVPTTLLAAVDSSVGGKTAVNLAAGKNMAGVFAQPSLVLCDTDVMRALPERLVSDGAAEIVKYGVLSDPALLRLAAEGRLMDEIGRVVERCVQIKRDYVAEDEFDQGPRQLLNLGHTLGHAAEKCSGYSISHGQGVAIGMTAIARAAFRLGVSEQDCAPEIERALRASGLPTECPYPAGDMLEAALMDKKRRGSEITLAVPMRIGCCELRRVPADNLAEWIQAGGIG